MLVSTSVPVGVDIELVDLGRVPGDREEHLIEARPSQGELIHEEGGSAERNALATLDDCASGRRASSLGLTR
jgi:hypothetical protein